MKTIAFTALIAVLFVVVFDLHVDRNVSDSLPIRYSLAWRWPFADRGDLVEACPPAVPTLRVALARGYVDKGPCPSGSIRFLKLIAGVGNDVVNVDAHGVSVNGRLLPDSTPLSHDSKGRQLNAQPYGVRRLPQGYVWLYGTNRSLDSRYIGAIPTQNIAYHVIALGTTGPIPDLRGGR